MDLSRELHPALTVIHAGPVYSNQNFFQKVIRLSRRVCAAALQFLKMNFVTTDVV